MWNSTESVNGLCANVNARSNVAVCIIRVFGHVINDLHAESPYRGRRRNLHDTCTVKGID